MSTTRLPVASTWWISASTIEYSFERCPLLIPTLRALQRVVCSGYGRIQSRIPKGYSSLLFLPRWNRHFWWRHREREADHHTRCIEKHPVPTTRSSHRNWESQTNNARVCVLTMVKCCAVCQESQTEHSQQPLLAQDVPSTPWAKFKVASDVFQIKVDNYLLVTDYPSKFYLVEKMQSTTNSSIANKSAQWFSMFEPPLEIVTDNGPQYGGQPYEDMFSKWNIKYTTTSPIYPQVRTVKWIIHQCVETGNDTIIALQQHRCTSLDNNLSSPSEILFNRPIRTTLASHHPTLMQQNQQLINEQLLQRRDRMIRDHDRHAGPELPALHAGQRVRILNKNTHLWSSGEIVTNFAEPCSYIVQTPNSTRLRRTTELEHAWERCKLRTSSTKLPSTRTSTSDIPRRQHRWRRLSRRTHRAIPW